MNYKFSYSPILEKNLNQLIKSKMKRESYFSPFCYYDNFSKIKSRGFREKYNNPCTKYISSQQRNAQFADKEFNFVNENQNINKYFNCNE